MTEPLELRGFSIRMLKFQLGILRDILEGEATLETMYRFPGNGLYVSAHGWLYDGLVDGMQQAIREYEEETNGD